MRVLAVIPARYGSTRFLGKPLADVGGRSLIERCWRAAMAACSSAGPITHVVVATDDRRIFDHVAEFGGEVWMTRADHPSGTDRLLELAERLPGYDAYLNLQGDEPFITPDQLSAVCGLVSADSPIGTLVKPISDPAELSNPNAVKAVVSASGHALYFSRQALPYLRDEPNAQRWVSLQPYYKHLGIYAFHSSVIDRLRALTPSPLELAERLEQLRWLEAGLRIAVAVTEHQSPAIDTPDDLARILADAAQGLLRLD